MNKLSEITKRDIVDIIRYGFTGTISEQKFDYYDHEYIEEIPHEFNMPYSGRLDEIAFLKRIYDLENMPSFDNRFENAYGDIWQHTINNDDWDTGWVFEDERFQLSKSKDDKYLLNFLCEMFHPVVRDEKEPWREYLNVFNELLKLDGYELYEKSHISGRAIYCWKEIISDNVVMLGQIDQIKDLFNTEYIDIQVDLMYKLINTAPHSSIGKAKELFETCCKTILDEQEVEYNKDLDLMQLMKATCKSIGLSPKDLKENIKGKEIAAKILGNLAAITQGMAELRNLYGDGHGKNKDFISLPPRYADLAVGASVASVKFLWDTYQERFRDK